MTKEKIEAYFEAREALLKCFDVDYPELIEDKTSNEWAFDGEFVNYLENDAVYDFDSATLIGESEGYQLFSVYDNNKEFYFLFHEDKQITDEDEIEEKFE